MKKKSKEESKGSGSLSRSYRSLSVLPLAGTPLTVTKVTKSRYKEYFLPAILELVADEEGKV
jgi:hypothetical protein